MVASRATRSACAPCNYDMHACVACGRYVVTRGLVLYGGRVLNRGMAWGDDVILTDQRYFLPYHARAMTYVDVMVLDRETLMQVACVRTPRAADSAGCWCW